MTSELVVLVLVVITALGFDFTNGFHDTGNAMATSIATGALRPKVAVALSASLNLLGAFLSVEVALTVTNAVIKIQDKSGAPKAEFLTGGGNALLIIVMAGLVGGIVWNLVTWLVGLPSSSSHALFGGLIGAAIAGLGFGGVNWVGDGSKLDGVVGKVILPALLSPVIAAFVATVGTWLIYRITAGVAKRRTESGFRWGQIGSASLVSLAHGTNDAQKTMGVITLALIASGHWSQTGQIPLW
ncbi:MAG: inorganic phosphate transporter, partial [Terracoccus sp.]